MVAPKLTLWVRDTSILLIIVFQASISYSQDQHFTQYNNSNTSLNPALTGNFEGDLKLTALYRSQWSQVQMPMKTGLFSFEKNIPLHQKEFGLGATFLEDQTGAMQLKTTKALLSGSLQFKANKNFFRIGIQTGLANKRMDLNGQTFPTQWNYATGKYENDISNGETGLQASTINAEINGGLSWSRTLKKVKITAGFASFYLNRPKDKILNYNQPIPYRHVLHLNADYNVSRDFSLHPRMLFMQTQNAVDFLSGIDVSQYLTGDSKITAGIGYRTSALNSDAVFFLAGYQKERLSVNISMDANLSLLSKEGKRKSSLEISIAYITPTRYVKERTIPCQRY